MADLPLRCQLDLWFQLSSCHFVVRHRKVSHRFPGDFQTPRFPSDWLHAFHRHWSQFHCRRTVRGEWDRSSRATINGSARRLTFNHARLTAIFWGCVLAVSLCRDVDAEVKPHRWICQCRAARVGCCAGEQSRFIGAVQSPVTCKQRNTRTHTDIRTDSNRYKTTRLNRGYYSVMQIDACLYFQMQVHICMSSRSHATSLTQPQPHHRASWHMKLPPHHPLWIITWQQILSCCCMQKLCNCASCQFIKPRHQEPHTNGEIIQNRFKNARFPYITQSCYQVKLLAQTRQHAKTQRSLSGTQGLGWLSLTWSFYTNKHMRLQI